jgi:hypothetical protein
MYKDSYSGHLKVYGKESFRSLIVANNYASLLNVSKRPEEAKSLLHEVIPVARRTLGDPHELTLTMRGLYAELFYRSPGATFADLRESVTTLEDVDRIARRVLGSPHPLTKAIVSQLHGARVALRARETQSRK